MNTLEKPTLMLVTQKGEQTITQYLDFLEPLLTSGITSIQIREKTLEKAELIDFIYVLKDFLKNTNIKIILNDQLYIASETDVDGVHLGQSDADPVQARKILGADKIIGLTTSTLDEIGAANQLDCINYVGVGAIFKTNSKPDIKNIWGAKALKEAIEFSKYPVIAIGGIDEKNITQINQTNLHGVAIIGGIHRSLNPAKSCQKIKQAMQ